MTDNEVAGRNARGSGSAQSADGKDAGLCNPSFEACRRLGDAKNGPLRSLFVMVCLEVGGFAMAIPVLSFFAIKELGLEPSSLGLVISANATTQLIGAWTCGRLSDSWGRRWLLIVSFAWSFLGVGATAWVYSFWELLILRMLQGLSGGTTPLCQAYILDVSTEEERPGYLGLYGLVTGIAFILGNAIGMGLLALGLQRRTIFLVAAFFCGVATVYGFFTLTESLDPKKRRPLCPSEPTTDTEPAGKVGTSDWEAVGVGLLSVWTTRFFQAFASAIMFSTYAFLINDFFGWTDIHLGAIMVSAGVVYAILQFTVYPLFGRRGKIGSALALAVASVCGAAAALLFPTPVIWVHILALGLICVTGSLFEPAVPVLVGYFAGRRHIGFGNGVATAVRCGASILGPFIGGLLYEENLWLMFMVGAACYAICLLGSGAVAVSKEVIEDEDEAEPLVSGNTAA